MTELGGGLAFAASTIRACLAGIDSLNAIVLIITTKGD
jgi:hypothetical protein